MRLGHAERTLGSKQLTCLLAGIGAAMRFSLLESATAVLLSCIDAGVLQSTCFLPVVPTLWVLCFYLVVHWCSEFGPVGSSNPYLLKMCLSFI